MKRYKLKLIAILCISFIKQSFAVSNYEEIMSESINQRADSNIIREVCKNKYNNNEIKKLEKLANKGDNNAQLKLGIIYDIKALQIYKQVWRQNNDFDLAIRFSHRESPCDYIK